jgi:hypothetical protein
VAVISIAEDEEESQVPRPGVEMSPDDSKVKKATQAARA